MKNFIINAFDFISNIVVEVLCNVLLSADR